MQADDKLIEARKDIEAARDTLAEAKEAQKAAKDAFDAANDRFLRLFDEANELTLYSSAELLDSDRG